MPSFLHPKYVKTIHVLQQLKFLTYISTVVSVVVFVNCPVSANIPSSLFTFDI